MSVKKKKAAKKAAPKKSVAAIPETTKLKEGDVFTATYGRKQVQGEVIDDISSIYDLENVYILGSHTAGEPLSTEENSNGVYAWTRSLEVRVESGESLYEALRGEGLTNFRIVNDKKEKAAILNTKVPEQIGDFNYLVEDGKVIFGCGAIEVTKKQIEGFLEFRKKVWAHNKKLEELKKCSEGKLYDQISYQLKSNVDEDSTPDDIVEEDVKKLLSIL